MLVPETQMTEKADSCFKAFWKLAGRLQGHSEARGGEFKIRGAAPIRMLNPILLRRSVDAGLVKAPLGSCLALSEFCVSHVMVVLGGCRHRSMMWWVSMTPFLIATL